MPKTVSIILPCYRPPLHWAQNLANVLLHLQEQLQASYSFEIILVNDGSDLEKSDIQILEQACSSFHLINIFPNQGKGNAVRIGALQAKGNILITTDIDFPYTIENFVSILHAVDTGADISWVVRGEDYYREIPLVRKWLSKLLQKFIEIGFNIPYSDTQGGLKGFNTTGKQALLATITPRYLYDLELIILGTKQRLKLAPIEGHLREKIKMSSMPIRIMLQELSSLLKIRFFH